MSLVVLTYWWTDPASKHNAKYQYTSGDVRLLQRMVKRHLTVPHEFAVVTDRPDEFENDADIRAILIDWTTHVPGRCFVRLMTFHPTGADIGERVLQMDLDTVVVGNMDALVDRNEDLVLWRNPSRVPWENPVKPGRPYYNTSILLHRCETMPEVWEQFHVSRSARVRDDQWWLAELLGPDMPYFDGARDGVYRLARADTPGSGVNGELPENARIVFFPGSDGKWFEPRIAAANPWIERFRQ
jgi:hypothetical protein